MSYIFLWWKNFNEMYYINDMSPREKNGGS
jgi:hypothetical protein